MPIICTLEGNFIDTKATKNPEYFTTGWAFPEEVYGKIFQVKDMPSPRLTKILCSTKTNSDLFNLKPGQKCQLTCSLSVKKASNGYPPSINFNILECKVLAHA